VNVKTHIPQLHKRLGGRKDKAAIFQPDERQKKTDACSNSPVKVRWNRFDDLLPKSRSRQDKKHCSGKEDGR
jgi:hypothetical protein